MELRYSSRPTMGVEYMVTEPSYVGSRKTYIEKIDVVDGDRLAVGELQVLAQLDVIGDGAVGVLGDNAVGRTVVGVVSAVVLAGLAPRCRSGPSHPYGQRPAGRSGSGR